MALERLAWLDLSIELIPCTQIMTSNWPQAPETSRISSAYAL
jgi:hypothetical protein